MVAKITFISQKNKKVYDGHVSQERLKELLDYDSETGNLIWKIDRGSLKMCGKVLGRVMSIGYRQGCIDEKLYYVHRLVWLWHKGVIPTRLDHINRDKLCNRIDNLREVSSSESNQNRSSRNALGIKGVRQWPNHADGRERYVASLKKNGKFYGSRVFYSLKEAQEWHSNKLKEIHGEFYCKEAKKWP